MPGAPLKLFVYR